MVISESMTNAIFLKIGIIGGGIGIVVFFVSLLFIVGRPTEQPLFKDVEFFIKEIKVSDIDTNNAKISIIFSLINPNPRSVILESLDYELFNNNIRIGASGVGRGVGNTFVGSSADIYYIVGGNTLDIKDNITIKRLESNEVFWRDIGDNTLNIRVKGKYIVTTPQVEGGKEYTFDKELEIRL